MITNEQPLEQFTTRHDYVLFDQVANGRPVGVCQAGTNLLVVTRRNSWVFVQSTDGLEGWLNMGGRNRQRLTTRKAFVAIGLVVLGAMAVGTIVRMIPIPLLRPTVIAATPIPVVPTAPSVLLVCKTSDGNLAVDRLKQFKSEWDDASDLAFSTARVALNGPVGQLQRVQREVQIVTWPNCAIPTQTALLEGMNATIEGFLGFMQADETQPIPAMGVTHEQLTETIGQERSDAIFYASERQMFGEAKSAFATYSQRLVAMTSE
jgi:hypothetical protein